MSNIWTAASEGDIERVRELLLADKTLANSKDQNGYTPMHAAASWKHIELLKYLIESGGDVNICDSDGDTPLHICEDKECALLLLENGADASAKNHEGLSPVHTTLENEATEVTELLCERLGIPVPTIDEEADTGDNEEGAFDGITDAKLEDLSKWLMQNVDENSEADEDALRELVTKYIMQNVRSSVEDTEDTDGAADAATAGPSSEDKVSKTGESADVLNA
ncbi:hypothetical protein GGI07_005294 [Coemansia sp. Benny D115]|nr:hypothetical protein GGI07_005294 [Coemansia sp. Benny D115]